jgi:D-serine deaminase-like pyridoxal phosphate-dependent protein
VDPRYRIDDTREIFSPALLLFRELLDANLDHLVRIAGSPGRLRPHCKTHKIPQVTRIELDKGITKHKAATLAEVEMLAQAGAKDIFLAYNLVGPNIGRAVRFLQKYPDVRFMATADHPKPLGELSAALATAGKSMELLIDLNVGMNRTGIVAGPEALALYEQFAKLPGIVPGGFHVYDGHQQQLDFAQRTAAVDAEWGRVLELREAVLKKGLPLPRMVCGGTGSFPVYAAKTEPEIELSPGTLVFNDVGYSTMFPDLVFPPATVLLTRVVSRPAADRVTLDLGNKAVASDQPFGKRLVVLDLPDAEQVGHNEEHLVLKTPLAERYAPGDELLAVPRHICPTTAWHKQVFVISEGKLVDRWEVVGRDRWLTI